MSLEKFYAELRSYNQYIKANNFNFFWALKFDRDMSNVLKTLGEDYLRKLQMFYVRIEKSRPSHNVIAGNSNTGYYKRKLNLELEHIDRIEELLGTNSNLLVRNYIDMVRLQTNKIRSLLVDPRIFETAGIGPKIAAYIIILRLDVDHPLTSYGQIMSKKSLRSYTVNLSMEIKKRYDITINSETIRSAIKKIINPSEDLDPEILEECKPFLNSTEMNNLKQYLR